MEMPRWNELFLPALKAYSDKRPHINKVVRKEVADLLNLSETLRNQKNTKHGDNKIENRVGWAVSALKIAGLLKQYEHGSNVITDAGEKLLKDRQGDNFDEQFLIDNYPAYKENKIRNKERNKNKLENNSDELSLNSSTPDDLIENAVNRLDNELSNQLLEELRKMDPYDFESVVADLLKAMGYGELGEVKVTKKSGDEGVDAIVNEDALGLSKIFAQAKRYSVDNLVQEKAIRDFLGSLAAHSVQKGVFITTSDFSDKAIGLAKNKSVILINGDKMAELMIEYNVGVSVNKTYQIKKLDSDYFNS